jgi:trigger factor
VKLEIVDISSCQKQLNVELPVEQVNEKYNTVANTFVKQANIPGFRRGRAPISVIKARFRKEIQDEVVRRTLPQLLQEALDSKELVMVGEPKVNELVFEEGKPLVLQVNIDVLPNFELEQYRGLQIDKQIHVVTDEDVERDLKQLQEREASLNPIENRGVETGDFVTVDIGGKFPEDPTRQEIVANGVQLEIGSEKVREGISENLLGAQLEEERSFTIRYDQETDKMRYPKMAGSVVDYRMKVTAIKIKEVPNLDDEFAQSVGDYESLADLVAATRKKLEDAAEQRAAEKLRAQVAKELVESHRHKFEVPESLVNAQVRERLELMMQYLSMSGVSPSEAMIDWQRSFEQYRQEADGSIRQALILEKIADIEKIEVTDEEADAEIARIADASNEDVTAVKTRLTKENSIDSIKTKILYNKTFDLVIAHANVVEKRLTAAEFAQQETTAAIAAASSDESVVNDNETPSKEENS